MYAIQTILTFMKCVNTKKSALGWLFIMKKTCYAIHKVGKDVLCSRVCKNIITF